MSKLLSGLTLFAIVIFIFACKKNKGGDKNPLHLLYAVYNATNDSLRYDFSYDESGRITRIYISSWSQPTPTSYIVSYSGNQITMTYYDPFIAGITVRDTTILLLDSKNLLTKRIKIGYVQQSPALSKEYSYDTTTFQYNSQGLITGQSYSVYDSTWANPLSPQTDVRKSAGSITYTISNNNVMQIVDASGTTEVVKTASNTTTSKMGSEVSKSFDYASSYLNKTDFTNSVVLNEVNPITQIPIAQQFKNLPNKMSVITKIKDGSGNVTNTVTSQSTYQHTYNSDGLVASKTDSNAPGMYKYAYGR